MTIFITEPKDYSDLAIKVYKKIGRLWLGKVPLGLESEVKILVVRLAYRIDSSFLSKYPSVKFIISPTTGLTHIDMLFCKKKSIKIFSLQSYKEKINDITSTAELTLGLIIALLRKIPQAHNNVVNSNKWNRDEFKSRQLSNLSLGIIGLGRIGGHLANYAKALGMEVSAYDPFINNKRFNLFCAKKKPLDLLLKQSDIISINADLRSDNYNLIDAHEISLMQKHALIVNTARGALLNECAASKALQNGYIAGIAVDVLSEEHSLNSSLFLSPLVKSAKKGLNVIITPHIGGCTLDAMQITEARLAEFFFENMTAVL
jgi:D-3-phosphoglycerate dehydrogenase